MWKEMGNGASADESPNQIRVQATPTPRDNRTQNGGPPDRARRKGGGFQEVEIQPSSQSNGNTPRQGKSQNSNRQGQSSEGRGGQRQAGASNQRQEQAPGGSTPRQRAQPNQRGVRSCSPCVTCTSVQLYFLIQVKCLLLIHYCSIRIFSRCKFT